MRVSTAGLKILVLRGGALGDLILTLPVLDALRTENRRSFIELWGIQPQVGLVESADRIDRLDSLEFAPLFVPGPLPFALQRRVGAFDLAVSFLSDPEEVVAGHLASAGIRRVIKAAPIRQPGVHAVYQLASVLETLGLRLRAPVPRLEIARDQSREAALGFHLGSGSLQKNWPFDRWSDFAQRIAPRFERLILMGGEADEERTRKFQRGWRGSALEVMRQSSLPELARALGECAVFVGHDTGLSHLAAAVQTPTVALFGPTDPGIWRPLGDHVKVIRSVNGRMDNISVAAVLEAVGQPGDFSGARERDGK